MAYQSAVEGWHDFYVVAATSSATLVGLLFVGLTLHLRVVIAHADVRALARATLSNFGAVLVVGMLVAIPQDASGAGVDLLFAGAVSAFVVGRSILFVAGERLALDLRALVYRFGLSALGDLGIISSGALLLAGNLQAALSLLAAVTIMLLVISLRNSWDLLVTVGAARAAHEEPQA